jgi:hypothetical protein
MVWNWRTAPFLGQAVEKNRNIDAGTAQPAVNRLAPRLFLAAQLGAVEEGGVGGKDPAVEIRHHEGFRHVADDVHHARLGPGDDDAAGARRDGLQAHQVAGGGVLPEDGGAEDGLLLAAFKRQRHVIRPARGAECTHEVLDALLIGLIEQAGELQPHDPLHRLADEIGRRGVRFHHASGARIHHDDRLGGHLHQQPVARLRVPEPGIFLLDRLFGRQQPLLDGGKIAHVAADRHELALVAGFQQAVAHRNIGLARDLVIDLAPARRKAELGFLDHLLDLGPALDGGDLRPGLSGPGAEVLDLQFARGDDAFGNRAVGVDDQRDVRGGRKQEGCLMRLQRCEQPGKTAGRSIPIGLGRHASECHVIVLFGPFGRGHIKLLPPAHASALPGQLLHGHPR